MIILYNNEGRIIYAFDDIMHIKDLSYPENLNFLIIPHNIPNIHDYCVFNNELIPKMKAKISYNKEKGNLKISFVGNLSIKKVQLVIGNKLNSGKKITLPASNNTIEIDIIKDEQKKWFITIDDPLIEYKEVIV
ncbi:hypothetical protein XO11_00725 [Marinitoga sp. 1138]|nr:hypothetical protein [Marinitoga sp. 1138]